MDQNWVGNRLKDFEKITKRRVFDLTAVILPSWLAQFLYLFSSIKERKNPVTFPWSLRPSPFFLFLISMFFTRRTHCQRSSVYEKKFHNTSEMLLKPLHLHLCSLQKLSYQSDICVCTGSVIGSPGYKSSPLTKPQSARKQNTYLFTALLYFSIWYAKDIKIHS